MSKSLANKPLKVLATSQNFGFGPTSSLFSVIKAINKYHNAEISLLYNDAIATFSKKNKQSVVKVVMEAQYEKYDLLISSFDPSLIIDGWLRNIKTIYICNLFWFWKPKNSKSVRKSLQELTKLKESHNYKLACKKFSLILETDHHQAILIAHALADHCFIRKTPNLSEKLSQLGIMHDVKYTPCKIVIPETIANTL